jgi:hypothetical protein
MIVPTNNNVSSVLKNEKKMVTTIMLASSLALVNITN